MFAAVSKDHEVLRVQDLASTVYHPTAQQNPRMGEVTLEIPIGQTALMRSLRCAMLTNDLDGTGALYAICATMHS